MFPVPGRPSTAGERLPTRIEQALGRTVSTCSLFQGDLASLGEFHRQEQSKQEARLQCVPCSRETECSGGMHAEKNRASG